MDNSTCQKWSFLSKEYSLEAFVPLYSEKVFTRFLSAVKEIQSLFKSKSFLKMPPPPL